MHQPILRSLAAAALLAAAPVLHAQLAFPGGIRESGRHVAHAGRDRGGNAADRPTLTWMVGSGGELDGHARAMSALVGVSREAGVAVEAVLGYARTSPDGTSTLSAAFEVGLPVAPLAALGTRMAASGEGVWTMDDRRSYSAALSFTQPLGGRAELVGTAAYAVSDPGGGAWAGAFLPSLAAALLQPGGTELRLEYTPDNRQDGEDSFQLLAVQLLHPRGIPPFQLRAGVAKHRVLSVGILVFP